MAGQHRHSGENAMLQGDPEKSGFFASIVLFLRQVIDEMRKVVPPTGTELRNYTIAVLIFVAVIMVYISGLDQVFSWLVSTVFGTK